jgi:hypothetical protein
LAIPPREETYPDATPPLSASDFKFDYANGVVRIPVHAGEMSFIYGTTPANYTFPAEGVYTLKFSDDWNQIVAVNGQPVNEKALFTGGSWNDGVRDIAQVTVWNGTSLAFERQTSWYWTNNTKINSIGLADVDGDGVVEVVTGGSWNDGVRDRAQITVWNSETLAFERATGWYWTGDTVINSIALADVDADGVIEVVTGGNWNDGLRDNAQITVWNGQTLAFERVTSWYWTNNTKINSVSLADVDKDGTIEVVTGGSWNDGSRDHAQITVWKGKTLAYEGNIEWYWTGDTVVNSVSLGDVDGDGTVEIVSGGSWNDGVRDQAQITVWNGATRAYERDVGWYWTSDTRINSVALADMDSDGIIEVVTGGSWNDGSRDHAQITVWSAATLAYERDTGWYWTDNTVINSVRLADADSDGAVDVVTGGSWNDGVRDHAQVTVWNGKTLSFERVASWQWTGNTLVKTVAL